MTNREKRLRLLSMLDQADALASAPMIQAGDDAGRIAAASGYIAFAVEALSTSPVQPPADPTEKPLPTYVLDCRFADEPDGSGPRPIPPALTRGDDGCPGCGLDLATIEGASPDEHCRECAEFYWRSVQGDKPDVGGMLDLLSDNPPPIPPALLPKPDKPKARRPRRKKGDQ